MHRLRPLPLLLLLSGCADALGIAGDCRGEMTEVRLQEGQPDSTQRDEFANDFTEVWRYADGGRIRAYTFRWGASFERCEVTGPTTFLRAPRAE